MAGKDISIHALRVEGDYVLNATDKTIIEFLSTPSGWRATIHGILLFEQTADFYPRPPGGGRREDYAGNFWQAMISIHALRVEGDHPVLGIVEVQKISIHALRVEGDQ